MKELLIRKLLIFVFILWSSLCAWPQSGLFFTSDRLSNTNITSICQDKSGYIWIGTECGLNRFDGYKFTVYKNDPRDSTSLMFNIVNKVFHDREGNLWIGTNTGLQRYDYATDSFVGLKSSVFERTHISDICQLPDGRVLVGTAGSGLFRADAETNRLTPMRDYEADADDKFFSHMLVDAEGGLWKDGNKDFSHIRSGSRPQVFKGRHDPPMAFADADGKVLIMDRHRLRVYSDGEILDDYYDLSDLSSLNPHYWTLMRDRTGNIYIGTRGNGLFWIPPGSRKVQRYNINAKGINMNTSTVQTLFEDRQGNVWVGCWHKGILVIPGRKAQFTSWSFSTQKHDIGNYVSSVCQGENGITWCTVRDEGVYGFDTDGQLVAHPAAPTWTEFIYREKPPIGVSASGGEKGIYYLGAGTEVYAYDPRQGQSRKLLSFACNMINTMTDNRRGHLFFSAFGKGMLSYDKATGRTRHFSQSSGSTKSEGTLCNDWIMSMTADRDGLIWLATTNGVCCYDAAADSFIPFGWNTICEGKRCESLCETSGGNMLIGTMEGLYVWNRGTGKVAEFPNAERLRGLTIGYIVQDSRGDIWCSTSTGIWHCRKSDGKWVSHVSGSGLSGSEFIPGAGLYIPQDDRIFFATNDGITTFIPREAESVPKDTGDIRLTNMTAGGQSVKPESNHVSLPFHTHVITMEFSLMNFMDAANTMFEYRLNQNAGWTMCGEGQNSVTFANLPVGTHKIEVRATAGGIVSPVSVYEITIEAPWYRTTPAYILYFIGAICILALLGLKWRDMARMRLAQAKLNFILKSNHSLRTSPRHHILIVEKDAEIANSIISELNTQYKFDYAPNGKEALKMLLNDRFNLVISGVTMPVMDGITMLKRIKNNTAVSEIPVIILSSKEEVEHKLLGLKAGADAYISKPVDMDELHVRIDSLIDNVLRLRGKFSGASMQEERVEKVEVKGNDEILMERIMRSVNAHMSDPDYNVDSLASDVSLSRAQLHRKMKDMTGLPTGRFLRNLRMEQAARLLREGKINISQVADKVGYIDQAHFFSAFKTHFGMSPTEYMESKKETCPPA